MPRPKAYGSRQNRGTALCTIAGDRGPMASSIPLQIPPTLPITDEQFMALARANPDLQLERTAQGGLITMAPTGGESGRYNAEINLDVGLWNRQRRQGQVFDSSTGFRLPNGAIRSPDLAWVAQSRWNALTPEQRQGYVPLCPDFVIELASPTDTLADLQGKMREYQQNGCRLGWLIDPKTATVEIYRRDRPPETVPLTQSLSGETVLPGLQLNLATLFTQ